MSGENNSKKKSIWQTDIIWGMTVLEFVMVLVVGFGVLPAIIYGFKTAITAKREAAHAADLANPNRTVQVALVRNGGSADQLSQAKSVILRTDLPEAAKHIGFADGMVVKLAQVAGDHLRVELCQTEDSYNMVLRIPETRTLWCATEGVSVPSGQSALLMLNTAGDRQGSGRFVLRSIDTGLNAQQKADLVQPGETGLLLKAEVGPS